MKYNRPRWWLAFAALLLFAGPARGADKPNIVLFLSDDHGVRDAGCYGNDDVKTPNIDRLAAQGLRFRQAFAASPTCAPARSALYTGFYPVHNGAQANHSRIKDGIKTWPAYFKELGYRVVLVGKVHVKPRAAFDFEYKPAAVVVHPEEKRKWARSGVSMKPVAELLANPGDKPLCLIIATKAPHVPWLKNKSYQAANLKLPPYLVDTPETRQALANYYTDVSYMDAKLGEVMDLLAKHELEKKTVLIYTSDQGAQFPHAKWNLYDAGIHVPLIIRWSGKITAGSVSDAMISHIDLLPTMLDLVANVRPEQMDGRSFLAVLAKKRIEHRDMIFASHTGDGEMNKAPMRCLRTKTHKMVVNFRPRQKYTTHISKSDFPGDTQKLWKSWLRKAQTDSAAAKLVAAYEKRPAELFDLEKDEFELNSIASDPEEKELADAYRFRIKLWMREMKDPLK